MSTTQVRKLVSLNPTVFKEINLDVALAHYAQYRAHVEQAYRITEPKPFRGWLESEI